VEDKLQQTVSADVLTTKAAARMLGVSPATLEMWRWKKRGPAYAKPGGKKVVYRRSELERYLQAYAVTPGKDNRAA
jgi:excisionase family DNA binding protein